MTPQYYINLEATGDQTLAQEAVKKQQKIYGQYDKTVDLITTDNPKTPYRIALKGFNSVKEAKDFINKHQLKASCFICDIKTNKVVPSQ
jgi:SPOR domain